VSTLLNLANPGERVAIVVVVGWIDQCPTIERMTDSEEME
jgi:hypothetical protein